MNILILLFLIISGCVQQRPQMECFVKVENRKNPILGEKCLPPEPKDEYGPKDCYFVKNYDTKYWFYAHKSRVTINNIINVEDLQKPYQK